MYDYGIYPRIDKNLFYKQCEILEEKMPGFVKKTLLEDVDGTLLQIYTYPRGRVIVKNDEMLGDVHVESEFDLRPYGVLLKLKWK